MAQVVCIFHDRAETRHAKAIADRIRQGGFEPWMAERNATRDWRNEVREVLGKSDCFGAIVIWSTASSENPIVIAEAEATLRAKRRLLGVILDGAHAPLGLEHTPRTVAEKWDGGPEHETLTAILDKLTLIAKSANDPNTRIGEVTLQGRALACPGFVFSVSSFETQISPAKTLELLNLFAPPAILVSAYDVLGMSDPSPDVTPTPKVLKELEQQNTVIFLDSGNYEAYRMDDAFWQRSPWLLRESVSRLRCDVVFCHDRIVDIGADETVEPQKIASQISADLDHDTASAQQPISPIVHAPRMADRSFAARFLPELCALITKNHRPPIIAVAERELGDGILARARRLRSIRRALDRTGVRQPLHVLGTGNPLSMLILALAGGDIFDGLEWCRTVVDADTMRLHHFHQFDLLLSQRSQIHNDLLREYLDTQDEILTAKAKAVLHNLYFFGRFADELGLAARHGDFKDMFDRYLPGEYARIVRQLEMDDNR